MVELDCRSLIISGHQRRRTRLTISSSSKLEVYSGEAVRGRIPSRLGVRKMRSIVERSDGAVSREHMRINSKGKRSTHVLLHLLPLALSKVGSPTSCAPCALVPSSLWGSLYVFLGLARRAVRPYEHDRARSPASLLDQPIRWERPLCRQQALEILRRAVDSVAAAVQSVTSAIDPRRHASALSPRCCVVGVCK
jgi:hypothetical protein